MEYVHTLDVLESLDLSEVWTGHGEPIQEPAETIRLIKTHLGVGGETVNAMMAARSDDSLGDDGWLFYQIRRNVTRRLANLRQ